MNEIKILRRVLTEEQLIRVERIMSCDKGCDQKINALKEYYSRNDVKDQVTRKGWDTDMLAYTTIELCNRK